MKRTLGILAALMVLGSVGSARATGVARGRPTCSPSPHYAEYLNLNHLPGVYAADTVINGDLHVCLGSGDPSTNLAAVIQVFHYDDNIQLWNVHRDITLTVGVDSGNLMAFYQTLHFGAGETIFIRAILKQNGNETPIVCASYAYQVYKNPPPGIPTDPLCPAG